MLKVSPLAAEIVASECRARDLPETGGVRLFPDPRSERLTAALAVAFVSEPRPGDTVLVEGEARVFIAEDVDVGRVATRVLDVDTDQFKPGLILRRQT